MGLSKQAESIKIFMSPIHGDEKAVTVHESLKSRRNMWNSADVSHPGDFSAGLFIMCT